jgi:hypothetical protein
MASSNALIVDYGSVINTWGNISPNALCVRNMRLKTNTADSQDEPFHGKFHQLRSPKKIITIHQGAYLMKICFPVAEDRGINSIIYGHFNSAPFFLIVDADSLVSIRKLRMDTA